ncbi:MAG: DNA gyrase C-terminal beta-propeller domain-containing protein, partial [Pseudomonadota bacterium]
RGIKLQNGDEVVSMSVIHHFEASPDERAAYLKMRRAAAGVSDEPDSDEEEAGEAAITPERFEEMQAAENLILTITEEGAGKLSSSHGYPVRGRGGQGVHAWSSKSNDTLIASFPVQLEDQIMLATSGGQSIRVPVKGISFRSRSAGGVRVFNTAEGEKVVSVAWIAEAPDEETEEGETETQTADDEA